jgi:nitrate reductase NapAB chaperone NapD
MSFITNLSNQAATVQVVSTLDHTIDNVATNVLEVPGLLTVTDESETGSISVILWGDTASTVIDGSASFINTMQLVVKKVNLAGTSIDTSKIKLFR